MSGSGNDIPIIITTGDSGQQVAELTNRITNLYTQVGRLQGAFGGLDNGVKAVSDLTRTVSGLARVLSSVSSDVTFLNAAAQAANNTARAARELGVQSTAREGNRVLAQAYRSSDPQRVANTITVTERELNAARIRQEQAAQEAARATGRELRSAEAQYNQLSRSVETLTNRLEKLRETEARLAADRRVETGVASRQVSRRTSQAFGQTDEALEDQMARVRDRADAAAAARVRADRNAQRRRDEADQRAADALQNAVPNAIERRRTGLAADAVVLTDATLRNTALGNQQLRMTLGLEALDRALKDTTGTFSTLRTSVAAANQQISARASLQNANDPAYQALQTQLGVAGFRQRLNTREAVNGDAELSGRDAALGRQQTLTRLFGDGGAGTLQVQAGLLANYAILNNLFSAFTNTAQAVVGFDNALKNLQAISASTNGEMVTLSATIVAASQRTRFSAVELTEASTQLAQAGLSVREIGTVLPNVALLATATGTSLKTAAEITTTALTVFRLRADETARVTDQMTAALNLSKLTIDQVGLGLQYVGNTAAETGLSLTETTAILATLANQGIRSGSTIGTGTRQLLTDLSQPSDDLKRRLRELGIGMEEISVRSNGLAGVLQNLQRAGFTSADAFATMELRAAEVFTALLRGSQDMGELTRGIQSANGAAEANAVQMTSLRNRFLQLTNTVNALAFNMSGPLVAGLGAVVSGLTGLVNSVSGSTGTLTVFGTLLAALAASAVVGWLVRLVSGFGLFAGIIPAAVGGMQAFATAAAIGGTASAAASVGMSALNVAMRALPLVAIIGGVTALFLAMRDGTAETRAYAEQQEKLKQASSEASSAYATQRAALQSVDEFMSQTINRSRAFSDETKTAAERQAALNAQIEEARSRFGSLSGAVFGTINSYGQLIGVLATVRRDLNATASAAALTAQAAAGAELAGVNAQLNRTTTPGERAGMLQRLGLGGGGGGLGDLLRPGGAARIGDLDQALEGLRPTPELRRALEIALRTGSGTNANEVNELRAFFQNGAGANLQGLPPQLLSTLRQELAERSNLFGNAGRLSATSNVAESNVARTRFEASPTFDRASEISRLGIEALNRAGDPNSASTLAERQSRQVTLRQELDQRLNEMRALREGLSESERTIFDNSIPVADLNRARTQLDAFQRTLTDTETGAGRRAANRTIEANQRALEELRSRGADVRDPARVRELQIEANRLIDERERLQLEAIPAQARQELGPNAPTDVDSAERAALEAGVRAGIQRLRNGTRTELARSVAEDLQEQIQGQIATLRTLLQGNNRGGLGGSATQIAAQRGQIAGLIRQRGELLGLSPEAISAQLNRQLDQPVARAGASAGNRAADLAASERDERESRNRSQELARINRLTNTDVLATQTSGRADRALIEAARRDTNLLTEGATQAAQRRVNEADIAADIAQIDIRTRQIEQLAVLADRINTNLRAVNAQIAALPPEGNRSAAEIRRGIDLTAERQSLQGILESTEDQRRNAETLRERSTTLRDLRTRRDSGSPIDQGFSGAWMQLQNQFSPQGQARGFETDFLNMFNNMRTSFGTFVTSVASGSKSVGTAIKDMAKSILEAALNLAANRLATQLIGMGLKFGMSLFGGGGDLGAPSNDLETSGLGAGGGVWEGAYNGGVVVQRFARGGIVSGAHLGRDSVPAMLAPGEGVLNRRAVGMIGTDSVKAMNDGLMQRSNSMGSYNPPTRDPDMVNVYVVAPNEKPTLGPKDVLTVIGNDILQSGSTKSLIRQVALGAI